MEPEARYREALTDWKLAQHLSECVPLAHRSGVGPIARALGWIPLLGGLIRSAQRVRFMGAVSRRQVMLNELILQHMEFVTHFMTSSGDALAGIQNQLSNVVDQQRSLDERLFLLREQILQTDNRCNGLEATLALETTALADRVTEMTSTVGALSPRVDHYERDLRLNIGHVRFLQQQFELNGRGPLPSANGSGQPILDHLVEVIQTLEDRVPELAQTSAVNFSIQDGTAEPQLHAVFGHLGSRLATAPSDIFRGGAWIHVDLTTGWERPDLFAGVRRKVMPGGLFVLITDGTGAMPRDPDGLSPVFDERVPAGDSSARACIWRRV